MEVNPVVDKVYPGPCSSRSHVLCLLDKLGLFCRACSSRPDLAVARKALWITQPNLNAARPCSSRPASSPNRFAATRAVLLRGPPAKPLAGPAARLRVRGAGSVCCPLPLCSGRPPPLGRARPTGHCTRPSSVSSTSAPASNPCQARAALHCPDAPDRPATAPVLNVCPGLHPRRPASPSLLRCPLHI
jgi:hypothetical protein